MTDAISEYPVAKRVFVLMLTAIATVLMAGKSVEALRVSDDIKLDKIGTESAVWDKAAPAEIVLYPQTTIRLNDKKANKLNIQTFALRIKVSALFNSDSVAFLLKWPDPTRSIQSGTKSDEYPDGFAVQIATKYDDPGKLPYIGMGSKGRPVVIYLQKAARIQYDLSSTIAASLRSDFNASKSIDDNSTEEESVPHDSNLTDFNASKEIDGYSYKKVFTSEGFGSMMEQKDHNESFSMQMKYSEDGWKSVFVRPIRGDEVDLNTTGTFPVAFAVWDGEKLGRDGLKRLSSWIAVKLGEGSGGDGLIRALTSKPDGDPKAGKERAEKVCAGCHVLESKEAIPSYAAPNLINIGGYSTAGYLRESIVDPNAVIVPGYNRGAHRNFAWYSIDANGTRASVMPAAIKDEKVIDDLVSYLMTLKMGVE